MISRIHDRLGPAGFVIAIIALVAALSGGAYAATGGLSGKQKKEVTAIAKKYAGKPGLAGATGPAGPAGAAGAKGEAGAAGTNGTNGTSVTNTALAKGDATCPEGGAEFKVGTGTATHACNGQTGFTETLPPGKTETGTWSFVSNGATEQVVPIGFPIPLAAVDAEAMTVEFLNKTQETSAECPGTVEEPKAQAGVLCIYTTPLLTTLTGGATAYKPISKKRFEEPGEPFVPGVVSSGTYLDFENITSGQTAGGTFAVTAPLAS
jgi:hypothetical protein